MKTSPRIIASLALLASVACNAQSQTIKDLPCRQATTFSMLEPDKTPQEGALLVLRNISWAKGCQEYVFVPALEFDLSSISKGTRISSAVLKLTLYGRGRSLMRPVIRVFPITAEWLESTATWNTKPPWDESFTELEVPSLPNDTWSPWEIDVTPLVKKWVNGEMENHGLAIVADSTEGDVHNFAFYGPTSGLGRSPTITVTFDGNPK